MKIINNTFQQAFCRRTIDNILKLLIHSYNIIKTESLGSIREDHRRNQLVDRMKSLQNQFGISAGIGNCDEYDSLYKTIGRTDIAFIFGSFSSQKIIFECKRFKDSSQICKSYVQKEYIGEGLNRFIDEKYSVDFSIAGMIAFVESGDCEKCFDLIKIELSTDWVEDESKKYNHSYIGQSQHITKGMKRFFAEHLIFDFS
jgi:hypothetical protein